MGEYFPDDGLAFVIFLSHVGHLLPIFLLSSSLSVVDICVLFTFFPELANFLATS